MCYHTRVTVLQGNRQFFNNLFRAELRARLSSANLTLAGNALRGSICYAAVDTLDNVTRQTADLR